MNKNISPNFAYAILIVFSVGFLLWHNITMFNLQRDLESLQNDILYMKGTVVTKSQKDDIEESHNTQILYNEDGSIDTSNWKTYTSEEYGFSVKYPGMYFSNVVHDDVIRIKAIPHTAAVDIQIHKLDDSHVNYENYIIQKRGSGDFVHEINRDNFDGVISESNFGYVGSGYLLRAFLKSAIIDVYSEYQDDQMKEILEEIYMSVSKIH